VFIICSLLGFLVLGVRRNVVGGELGGPKKTAYASSAFLVFLWVMYVTLSILHAAGNKAAGAQASSGSKTNAGS